MYIFLTLFSESRLELNVNKTVIFPVDNIVYLLKHVQEVKYNVL